jgi:hypothetical protein
MNHIMNLEKMNHITTQEWARGTNHKEGQNEQIMRRRIRQACYLYDFECKNIFQILF